MTIRRIEKTRLNARQGYELRTVLAQVSNLRLLLKAKVTALNLEAEPHFAISAALGRPRRGEGLFLIKSVIKNEIGARRGLTRQRKFMAAISSPVAVVLDLPASGLGLGLRTLAAIAPGAGAPMMGQRACAACRCAVVAVGSQSLQMVCHWPGRVSKRVAGNQLMENSPRPDHVEGYEGAPSATISMPLSRG